MLRGNATGASREDQGVLKQLSRTFEHTLSLIDTTSAIGEQPFQIGIGAAPAKRIGRALQQGCTR